MKIVGIIQARLNSTRLPGKVLLPLAGKSMLWHIIERVKRAKLLDEVMVALPGHDSRELFKNSGEKVGCDLYFVSKPENDLIGRYYDAAFRSKADIIVRLCADNPFVEPGEIDRAVQYFLEKPRIFVSNMHQHKKWDMLDYEFDNLDTANGYPDGIGCEVFSMSTLKWMHEYIKDPVMREHPHKIFHDEQIIESPRCPEEFSRPDLKLDVNVPDEYIFSADIYNALYPKNPNFHITDVIAYIDKKKCPA